jgi:molybdopterin-guanine dinucleotide biosynthesis protein
MPTAWIETTVEIYRFIFDFHGRSFTVFESFTSETDYVTTWGFKNADYPIIKVEKRGDIRRYFLAQNKRDTES